ncbi:hypothetical protein Tco_0569645 [Tanacetum coccineum]
MIDSQMDDMIKEKLALKEQVDSLEQNISKQIKEKECLLQTFTIFKSKSKEKEDKYMENEIDLEKKIKELDNIIYKVGQSAQTVHMLTKPQAFYDNIHKQALGYQNLFYLKKARRIKPTLYDGIVMSVKHGAMPVSDDEETLILEEDSRSKMFENEKDLEVIKQNISHKPIDYEKLTRLSNDFGKRFTPQQELSTELAFWLRMSNPTNTSDARTEGEWGFTHTKAVFNNEIISFLKSLKDIFNVFDRDLLNEIMEVQTVFDQMDAAVQQSSIDKQCLEIAKKELLLENDRLLQQIMSQDVVLTVMNSMSLIVKYVNMDRKRNESCDKCFNLEAELLKSQNAHNDLLKSYSQLEKHCISLELSIQLNQEIFQKDESYNNQNALEIPEFLKNNDLKAQLQDKDTTICKLKDIIKSMREKSKEENVNYDYCEIETKNVELENSVAKLISENKRLCNEINHVKQVFKEQFDSIKKTRVRTKEQSDSLIDKLNLKSAENEDLKAQIQDKVFVITSLKNDLRKVKGKEIVDIAAQIPSANTIVPGMFKLDLEPLAPRLLQNREAHIDYLKYTQEQADILRGIVEQAKAKQPLDKELDFACKHAQRIQELLVYVRDTCPNAINLSAKKVVVTPKNKVKKVRFAEPLTSSSNIKQVESSTTSDSNTPVLSAIGLKCSTSSDDWLIYVGHACPRVVRVALRNFVDSRRMSTPVFAYLDGMDTKSEPFEEPIDTKTLESPLAIAPPISISESTPPVLIPILRMTARIAMRVAMSSGLSASMAEVAAMSESVLRKRFGSSYDSSLSVSPPDLPSRKRYRNGEGPTVEDEDPAAEDEGLTAGVEGPGIHDEGYGLDDEKHGRDDESYGIDDEGHSVESDGLGLEEEDEAAPGGQQQAAPVAGTAVSAPLGLGYRVLRRRELALEEGDVYSTFETPPSPEWTSSSLLISPSHYDVPSPISSPMIPLIVPSPVATLTAVETE